MYGLGRDAQDPGRFWVGQALDPDELEDLSLLLGEVFELVRVQGLTYSEAAGVLGVSPKTVQRRLNRSLILLRKELDHLRPA